MRVSTLQTFQAGLARIQQQQARVAEAQRQVATGRRIETAADDPSAARRILDLEGAIGLAVQFRRNADAADARLGAADATLARVGEVLLRAREIAISGHTPVLGDADRGTLATELEHRLEELVGLANGRDGNGEYLFSGYATATRPFSADASGEVIYAGDQGTRSLPVGPSARVPVSEPGSSVFERVPDGNGRFAVHDAPGNLGTAVAGGGAVVDPGEWVPGSYTIVFTAPTAFEVRDGADEVIAAGGYAEGGAIAFAGIRVDLSGRPQAGDAFVVAPSTSKTMFATLRDLVDALRAPVSGPADQARLHNAMARGLAELEQADARVNEVRARVGARLGTVDHERALGADLEVLFRERLSDLENIDLVEAVLRLNADLGTLEAAQRSFARVQQLRLMDFL
jgi:flagellar hook-associated protein 3 FlgL